MKTRTKFFLVVIALSVCCIPLFAQISEGGLPPSFQYEKKGSSLRASDSNEAHIILPINFDVKQLIAEDKEAEAAGESINCAKIIPVDLTMENSGVWSTLSNGQEVWQLTIEAPKAIALLLYYRDFYIPQGGKLFIYNKEKTQVLGAYNHTTNAAGRGFATEFVAGDLLTLEYVSPTGEASVDLPRIRIEGVSYGYNHLNVYTREKEGEEAATYPCYVNIVCSPEGDDWQNEAAGVVRIIFRKMTGTSSLCSGSMINNTKGDFAPYMLTAFHCVRETDASTLDQAVFYYNYNSASCSSNTAPATTQTVAGAQAKVETGDGYSDGALLLLNSNVPESYNPYFNGWDVTGTVVTGTMGIHHPAGDVKKISYSEFAVTHTKWTGDLVDGTHWRVPKYTETPNGKSIVEGGSSGSPLFSVGEHLIIGTLHGGHTVEVCENFELRYSSYGKLWFDWDQMTNPDLHMKTYLDPESTGALKLPGSAYTSTGTYTVTFSVTDGADGTPITNARITFNDVTNAAGNYTFTGVTAPRSHVYVITKNGYSTTTGRVSVFGTTSAEVKLSPLAYAGTGTEADPYLISNKDELLILGEFLGTINKDVHFRIIADIDMNESWTPIATSAGAGTDSYTGSLFCGKLHGGGHKLTNFTISSSNGHIGLFGVIGQGAYIDSLHIVGNHIDYTGSTYYPRVGSIAGLAQIIGTGTTDGITISACSNTASHLSIAGNYSGNQIGGIVGDIENQSTSGAEVIIEYCANSGDLEGGRDPGGIVGRVQGAGVVHIRDCYSQAAVVSRLTGNASYYAGLVGLFNAGASSSITNTYAAGYVSATQRSDTYNRTVGGIVARLQTGTLSNSVALQDSLRIGDTSSSYVFRVRGYNAGGTLSNNYANQNMVVTVYPNATVNKTGTDATQPNGADITPTQAKQASFYSTNLPSWDFTNAWAIREDISFPYFQYQSAPVGITSLYALNTTLNTLSASGNISIYKGNKKVYLSTLTVTAAGDNTYLLSEVAVGDTLFFVNNEPGKAPSYPVQGIVTSLGTIAVTFEVVDADDIPVTNAVVTLDGVTNAAGDYFFTGLTAGTYDYSVSKTGYTTQTGSVSISNLNIIKEIVLELKTTFDVTFVIKDVSATPITDATVTFDGVTNPVGDYTFTNNPNATYTYTVTKTGYKTATGNVTVSGEDIIKNVTMELAYIVAFSVVDIYNDPVGDAIITLDGVANPAGNYLFLNIANGMHSFSVTRSGYLTASGSLTVNNGNLTRNVVLQPTDYTQTFMVTFVIKDINNQTIDNAVITFNGITGISGDYVYYNIYPGTYTYSVIAQDYKTVTGTLTVENNNVFELLVMQKPTYTVSFTVLDEQNVPINDARIIFGTSINPAGNYTFSNIAKGEYEYTIIRDGYYSAIGNISVTNADVSKTCLLKAPTTGIDKIGGSAIVNLYPNPASAILNVKVDESLVPVRVDILSISGERYFTQTYHTALFTLDIAKYPAGLLLIKVSTKDSSIVKTIVKKGK